MENRERVGHTSAEASASLEVKAAAMDLNKLFENFGLKLFMLMSDLKHVSSHMEFDLDIKAQTVEQLLIEYTKKLIKLRRDQNVLFSEFHASVQKVGNIWEVKSKVLGEKISLRKHEIKPVEIVAAIENTLIFERAGREWIASMRVAFNQAV